MSTSLDDGSEHQWLDRAVHPYRPGVNIDTDTDTITKPGLFPHVPWMDAEEPILVENVAYIVRQVCQYFSRRGYWRRRRYRRVAADSEVSWLLD